MRVKAAFRNEGDETRNQVVFGTGFFVSRDGHVLTNASATHQAAKILADRVWVEHEGIAYAAEILGGDLSTNLALLKVLNLPDRFNFLHLTDSQEMPPIGTLLLRISSPLEFAPTPSLGMVAGVESRFGSKLFLHPYLRTTLPAGPGDGGAPVLDLNGKLVGIMVAALPEVQGSYFIPARAALRIRDDLLFDGNVTFGWLGFEIKVVSSTERGNEVVLSEIVSGTAAEEAGLLVDDILLRIGDTGIDDVSDVGNAIFFARPGQFISVGVARGDEEIDFTVRVAARPQDEPFEQPIVTQTEVGAESGERKPSIALPAENSEQSPGDALPSDGSARPPSPGGGGGVPVDAAVSGT